LRLSRESRVMRFRSRRPTLAGSADFALGPKLRRWVLLWLRMANLASLQMLRAWHLWLRRGSYRHPYAAILFAYFALPFMNDLFLARLDQRLARRNALLRNSIQAWADTLDALGWCVAIKGEVTGGLQLNPNAVAELERWGSPMLTWTELGEKLRAVPAGSRPVDDEAIQVWAVERAPPRVNLRGRRP
jgi:hypothetical protein